jgi:peptidoglycan/xylan/chitin deacetylase (PgdA/CDA1 family)
MTYLYIFLLVILIFAVFSFVTRFAGAQFLTVLMYHKISNDGKKNFLTLPARELEQQFQWLRHKSYTPILLSELVEHIEKKKQLPPNPVLITFDDGYKDNYSIMYPLARKYGMKVNIFLVPAFLQSDHPAGEGEEYLSINDIHEMTGEMIEFGLHSFDHKNYKNLSAGQIQRDIAQCKASLTKMGIPFQPCLAFPYGAYPKSNPLRKFYFFQTLSSSGIVAAFRIGNRHNPLPLRNPLLMQRLDIRGENSVLQFVRKLGGGRSPLSIEH